MIGGAARRAAAMAIAALALLAPAASAAVTIEPVVSPGGITAWLVEDHSLPVIALNFSFRGGAGLDPAGKEGVANLALDLLDEGAGDLDSEAYKRRLEDLSIRLDLNVSMDAANGVLESLTENAEPAFDLLGLALTRPRFDPDAIARVKSQLRARLAQDAQSPHAIANRMWWRSAFPDHSYGRRTEGTPESLAAIGPDDLRRFVAERLARDRLIVGVVGDISAERLKPLLDRAFAGLPAAAAPGALAPTAVKDEGALLLARKPVPQSVVFFGEQGLKRDDPDWYAAMVMNHILGGGLSSRLSVEIREKRGLAYSISTGVFALRQTGIILGTVATRNERVAEMLALLREQWQQMRDRGPTESELAASKTYLIGSFPLGLDSTRRIAELLVSLQVDGLGIDYLDRRSALIDRVTVDDVRRVARRLLDPDKLRIAVVGSPPGLDRAQEVRPEGG